MNGDNGLLVGRPDVLRGRWGFAGSLTAGTGKGGGVSTTGVGGRWIVTFGGASSAPRINKSANLSKHHRTSLSVSDALGELYHQENTHRDNKRSHIQRNRNEIFTNDIILSNFPVLA